MSIELNKESVEQADASSCQGTNCGTTTGDHSSECLAEAAAGQGWELKPGDLCGRDCPIHKILAEQAGGDERAVDGKPRATKCPDCGEGDLMPGDLCACGYETDPAAGYACSECDGSGDGCVGEVCRECDGSGWFERPEQARAALAQPSDEVVVTKNESGAIVSVTRQDKEGRVLSVIAESQPSPAQAEQAEAERPIVSFEKYMQVMYDRDENAKRLDAALAEVERIKTISDNYYVLCVERQQQLDAALARVEQQERTIAGMNEAHAKLAGLYEAAQAQHSVPEGVTIERDVVGTIHIKVGDFDFIQLQYQRPYTDNASTWKLAERIASLLAAAPGAGR
ncbi:hypothetical protein ACIUXF_07580 [Pseudomonas aeruginosa]